MLLQFAKFVLSLSAEQLLHALLALVELGVVVTQLSFYYLLDFGRRL